MARLSRFLRRLWLRTQMVAEKKGGVVIDALLEE
jgi:hypothetical protein